MGWNTATVLVETRDVNAVTETLLDKYVLTSEQLDWGDASAARLAPDLAIGRAGDWTIVYDPRLDRAYDDGWLAAVSRIGRTACAVTMSVATVYGFWVVQNGRVTRRVIRQDYQLVDNVGEPLPEEDELSWDDQEDAVLEMVMRLSGLTFADFESADFVRLAPRTDS